MNTKLANLLFEENNIKNITKVFEESNKIITEQEGEETSQAENEPLPDDPLDFDFKNINKISENDILDVIKAYEGLSEEDAKNKFSYDAYYIFNSCLKLDFLILVKTIKLILSGNGSDPNDILN